MRCVFPSLLSSSNSSRFPPPQADTLDPATHPLLSFFDLTPPEGFNAVTFDKSIADAFALRRQKEKIATKKEPTKEELDMRSIYGQVQRGVHRLAREHWAQRLVEIVRSFSLLSSSNSL
jgi:hypothetical protein